jgi:hypothetical protein
MTLQFKTECMGDSPTPNLSREGRGSGEGTVMAAMRKSLIDEGSSTSRSRSSSVDTRIVSPFETTRRPAHARRERGERSAVLLPDIHAALFIRALGDFQSCGREIRSCEISSRRRRAAWHAKSTFFHARQSDSQIAYGSSGSLFRVRTARAGRAAFSTQISWSWRITAPDP